VLAELLSEPGLTGCAARLVSFSGGGADNALPREAAVTFAVAPDEAGRWQAAVEDCFALRREALLAEEPDLELRIRRVPSSLWPVLAQDREKLLGLLRELPHGVIEFSSDFPGVVETSANLASVHTSEDSATIITSLRSFDPARLDQLFTQLHRQARRQGGEFELQERYPAWTPHPNSELVALTASVYRKVYGHGPRLEVMHGGLECGAVVARVSGHPPMEAVSFGPQIEGPHTPEECVYPATVATMWKMLILILKELAAVTATGHMHRGPVPPQPQGAGFKGVGVP
jgi:dipeptidase D